jgi:hypothetical protein
LLEILPLTCKLSIYWVLQHFYRTVFCISSTTNTSRKCYLRKSFPEHCLTAHQQEITEGEAHTCSILLGFSHKTVMLMALSCTDASLLPDVHFLSCPSPSIKDTLYNIWCAYKEYICTS